jgi:hypothetical protein
VIRQKLKIILDVSGIAISPETRKASENGCKDRKIQDCFRFSVQKRFGPQHCVIEFGDIDSMENLVMRFRRAPKRNERLWQS